jgi:hypothetical protein
VLAESSESFDNCREADEVDEFSGVGCPEGGDRDGNLRALATGRVARGVDGNVQSNDRGRDAEGD